MRRRKFISVILVFLLTGGALWAESGEKTDQKETKAELTLEKLFPKKSFFGPSARATAFSFDGNYAAYLYRPYLERRHGSDLWIYDVKKGQILRITSASVMAEFQASTRKVCEDRKKKAREATQKQKDDDTKSDKDQTKNDQKDKKSKKKRRAKKGDTKEKTKQVQHDNQPDEQKCCEKKQKDDEKKKGGQTVESKHDTHTKIKNKAKKNNEIKKDRKGNKNKKAKKDRKIKKGKKIKKDKNARKNKKVKGDKKTKKDQTKDEVETKKKELGDWVSESDADDEKAPRYCGISSFTWSPTSNELLFTSEGDVYHFKVGEAKPTRLTRTKETKKAVTWLPEGKGFTFLRGQALMKVEFGTHLIEQFYPKLPEGESVSGYRISPDGRRMVFLTVKKGRAPEGRAKKVSIANYRNRFMQAKEVSRAVSDDPVQPRELTVYFWQINQPMLENSQLIEVYRRTLTQPRDYVKVPEWSCDSRQVVFSVYEQVSGKVNIMEAIYPESSDKEDQSADQTQEAKTEETNQGKKQIEKGSDAEKADKDDKNKDDKPQSQPAKVVYCFLHTGGPTTPKMIQPYYLADNRHIVFLSEHSGFRHLYRLDPVYESLEPLTHGRFEVYPIKISKDHQWMFLRATKEHLSCQEVYRLSLSEGKLSRLSKEKGQYSSVAVSPDGTKVLANYVHFGTLRELVFIDTESDRQEVLTDSHPAIAHELTKPAPEFFRYQNRHRQDIYGYMFKPDDLAKDDKPPLLIYIYGGPLGTHKQVVEGNYNSSGYFFAYYMTRKHGYITCTIDPRGNSGYGGLFEKANFDQVGRPQVEDIVDGVHYCIEHFNVDPNRVVIHGWSFGGFQTQMCLYTEPDVFAAGIAGAGPTEWENYNAWYTSGTIGISQTGKADLKKFSLLPLAKNLKARLLLVHGLEDSNVLYQDTIRVYRELLKAGKETLVELFLDPTGGHGLGGDVKNLAKYRKYEEFLLRTIGEGPRPVRHEKESRITVAAGDLARLISAAWSECLRRVREGFATAW